MTRKLILPLALLLASMAHAADTAPLPTPDEVLGKAIARAKIEKDRDLDDRYGFTQRTLEEKFDKTGKLDERIERLYRTVSVEGKPFRRLVEKNGAPPTADDLKKEAEREKKFRERARKQETKKREADDEDDVELDQALIARYRFHVLRREPVGRREAYVLSFLPRSGEKLPEKRRVDRLLNRLEGMVWLDTTTYSLLKVDMHLTEPASFIGGVANVRRLDFVLEMTEVFPDYFAPKGINIALEGRRLFSNMNVKQSSVFSDYFVLTPTNSQTDSKSRLTKD